MTGVKENKFTTERLEALRSVSEVSSFNRTAQDGRTFADNLTMQESRFYATNCENHECGYRGTGWCNHRCSHFVMSNNIKETQPAKKQPVFTKKAEKSAKFIVSQRLATLPSNIEVFSTELLSSDGECTMWDMHFGIITMQIEAKCTISVPPTKDGQLRVHGIHKEFTSARHYSKFADFSVNDK